MTRDRRECWSCAALPEDGACLPARKTRGRPLLCGDCGSEAARAPRVPIERVHQAPAMRRAQYRAALRFRSASAQMDLVDLLVKAP